MRPSINVLDPAERAREKAQARAQDQRAVDVGEKSREQLRAENSAFAIPRARIRLDLFRTKHY